MNLMEKLLLDIIPIGSEVNCLEILKYSLSKGALTSLPFVNEKKLLNLESGKRVMI